MADVGDLLPMWLREGSRIARKSERAARAAFESMRDRSTTYARSMEALADAHAEAAEVYERRLRDIDATQPPAAPQPRTPSAS